MEIIKNGKVHNLKQFTKQLTCVCEAVLKADIEDLKYNTQKIRDYNGIYTEQSVCIICPECDSKIFLLDLPQDIVYYLSQKQNKQEY
jgi:hypothetical protein